MEYFILLIVVAAAVLTFDGRNWHCTHRKAEEGILYRHRRCVSKSESRTGSGERGEFPRNGPDLALTGEEFRRIIEKLVSAE